MVSDHEQRLSDLEEWQDQVNRNIASLQRLLNTTDYITAVTPLMEGGEEVGYTITFLNSDPINIYHGKKGDEGEEGDKGEQGDDGHTPQIGLTQGTDGNWYWTLDGELMLDKDNNPIRANGEDGQQGQQGQQGQPGQTGASAPTPQIKLGSTLDTNAAVITDNGVVQPAAWYLSVDGGQTWYRITGDKGEPGDEGDKGEQGDAFFADDPKLSDDGTHYTFTLSDDDNTDLSDNPTFKVPVYQAFSLGTGVLELNPGTTEIEITLPAGTTAEATAQVAKALLRVTLIRNDGSEVTASCILGLSYRIENGDTYTVYTPQGLLAWASKSDDYNCTLAADIDMSGQTWPRIMGFDRTFDGAGHTIRNLTCSSTMDAGFLLDLSGGTVKNLLLVNATISGYGNVGGIVGRLLNGTVIACAVSGCKVSGNMDIGGIAGGSDGTVTACYAASCSVTATESYAGQIAGIVNGSINACYYDGDGNGIGLSNTGTSATRVDNVNGWQAAAQDMNSQLAGNDYIWAVNPDEEARASLPLVLVPNPAVQ